MRLRVTLPQLPCLALALILFLPAGAQHRDDPGTSAALSSIAGTWPGLDSRVGPITREERQVAWVFFTGHGGRNQENHSADPRAHWRRRMRSSANCLVLPDLKVSADYLRGLRGTGVKLRVVSRWFNAASISATREQMAQVRALPYIREIRPVARTRRVPDPRSVGVPPGGAARLDYGPSYNQVEMLGIPEAHDAGLSGAGVRVLMLDTGYYTDHVAFTAERILAEWDFINQDGETQNQPGDPESQHRHGTATASALGGHWPGHLIGPAFACDFILAKTEDTSSETLIEEDYYVAALEWGESLGADVASSSLGYTDWYTFADMDGQTALVTQAVNIAVGLGVTVVNSAGNARDDAWGHIVAPADAFGVISVGAVDEVGQLTWFSSPGPTADGRIKPEVVAQGLNVAAAGWDHATSLRYFAGTSLACPLVAGCAALLLEAHPEWTPAKVRAALMSTADRAQMPDNDYGWGLVNLPAALEAFPEPGPIAIDIVGNQVRLRWPDAGYSGYRVYQAAQPWGPFDLLGETADTSWTGPSLVPAQSGFFRIQGQVSPGQVLRGQ